MYKIFEHFDFFYTVLSFFFKFITATRRYSSLGGLTSISSKELLEEFFWAKKRAFYAVFAYFILSVQK